MIKKIQDENETKLKKRN